VNFGRVHPSRVAVVAAALLVASCSPSPDVTERESRPATSERIVPPPSTAAPVPIDGSTPVTAPDPTGLPRIDQVDPAIVAGQLDNGLRYVIRDNDNPGGRVEMRLVVDAGSALEEDDQAGVAHFLEHMLFNGTAKFPENELIAVLRSFGAAFGADINAYTSYDETVYELTMPSRDADVVGTGLDVLEQWLSAATIDPGQVESERGIVLDEWRGSASSSNGRIFDSLEELLLTASPYEGRDPIGTDDAIRAMDSAPLRRFYDDWYRPDNASVIVVGDVDPGVIEQGVIDRFAPLTARGRSPERPELNVDLATEANVIVHTDPDVARAFAAVLLPLASDTSGTPEARLQRTILDALAFDIIGTRLGNDALRGAAPFDDARVDSSSFVRALDAPEIVVTASGSGLEASTQAVFDEYERVRRFGFSQAEVDRAVSSMRSAARSQYEGRESRQDADFADEYVRHVLEGEPIPTADDGDAFVNAVLDRASPETVAFGFVHRLAATQPHVLVVVPEREADGVPPESVFLAQAVSLRDRELVARPDEVAVSGQLMVAPAPVDEIGSSTMSSGDVVGFIEPLLLEFDNGVEVSLNVTGIVEGSVDVEARSQGGLAVLDDADVPAGEAAGAVVGSSGVATYDRVALDAFLADKEVFLQPDIGVFTEEMNGSAATSELEVLFQLIHLTMTAPRVDPVALDQYLDVELSYAQDPSIEPGYAEFVSLLDARYDDPRFLLPSVDSLSTVTAEDIDRVFRDRFGDASDFAFSFSGDFDLDDAIELSRRYLGTLPASGRVETVSYAEPSPPPGVVRASTTAGDGQQAVVSFLYTAPAGTDRRDDIAALILQEVITARLTDTIREAAGESYAPYAAVQLTGGATPNSEIYISTTTGTDRVDSVTAAVLAELADLRTNGPTDREHAAATEGVRRQLDLFSNPQINGEVLSVLVDPAGNRSFDDFVGQQSLVDGFGRTDIQRYAAAWMPSNQYITVRVLPR
jgi:zinc protease